MDNIEIDWDVVVYRYDPRAQEITIANWTGDNQPPLKLASVYTANDSQGHLPHRMAAIQKLVNLANEKLAIDLLAKDTAAK